MKSKGKKISFIILLSLLIIGLFGTVAYAAPATTTVPNVSVSLNGAGDNSPQGYVQNIRILILLTVLTLLPSILIMVTSFTRIIIVFSFLKSALGAQQSIPNQILVGLALFLTMFIMTPVFNQVNTDGIQPYLAGTKTQEQAIADGGKPLREFMLKQTRQKDLQLFIDMSKTDNADQLTEDNVPFQIIIPAFAISELKTAFMMGFLIYLPFLLIDLVVGSVLMSMGMFMLPPAMVSLPFKLLLFVMVDGWYLLVKSLVLSFV